jgi:demethylmenaquinone methyltransferase/2-methoxy-6-polyprenyl-1,4-benzoquinol methylase
MEAMSQTPAWDDKLLANPHAVADKRLRVQKMFAAIAPSYDLNNRLHSLWMDQRWRRKAVKLAELKATDRVVDVACGTGDLAAKFYGALWFLQQSGHRNLIHPSAGQVIGVDFTFPMLTVARVKGTPFKANRETCEIWRQEVERRLLYVNGDGLSLPLPDQSADVVSIAFGIRNVADSAVAIREFHRVLRPGGRLIILEFSLPTNVFLRGLYNFYFRKVLPRTATWISGDKTGAYKYLPESVNTFIGREQMMAMMRETGFKSVEQFPMTFGVCVCYRGIKKM